MTFNPPLVDFATWIFAVPFPKGIKFSQLQTSFGDYFNPANQSYQYLSLSRCWICTRDFLSGALINIYREKNTIATEDKLKKRKPMGPGQLQ